MKIGLVSTYTNATPPLSYGGECYYWHIANELGRKGHEVHLFGTGGSQIPPNGVLHLIPSTPDGRIDYSIEEWIVDKYKDVLLSCDIVHDCSLDHIVAEKLRNIHGKKEIVNTINGHTYWMPRPPFNVVTGSKFWQEDAAKHGLKTEMIYWGVDTEFYTPYSAFDKQLARSVESSTAIEGVRLNLLARNYYLWIARFHPDKGLDWVLDLAECLGFKLKVAGSLNFADHKVHGKKYLERIATLPNVEYVELPMDSRHHIAKRDLYRGAKAFLYPVQYQECFGMVVAEAMACGTPVIACPNGAMPELIDHELNGFLCKSKLEFSEVLLKRIPFFERHKNEHDGYDLWANAREKALQFDVRKAADAYEKLYERVTGGETW